MNDYKLSITVMQDDCFHILPCQGMVPYHQLPLILSFRLEVPLNLTLVQNSGASLQLPHRIQDPYG